MIFLNHNVPALKNGKVWTGKFLVSSAGVKKYLKVHGIKKYSSRDKTIEYYKNSKSEFKEVVDQLRIEFKDLQPPYKLAFHFVRESKHKFDFGNAYELLADIFTSMNLWEDDNMDIFHPSILYIEGRGYTYNKETPGVFIKIIKD